MRDKGEEKKRLAPESLKTRRAREKILAQWKSENSRITPKALSEMIEKIHKWIADNAKNRVPIKDKIELFNRNQNAAALSRKVQQFASKLKEDMEQIGSAFEQK